MRIVHNQYRNSEFAKIVIQTKPMFCPACATEVVDDQRYCRNCGHDLKPAQPARRNFARSLVGGMVLMMIGVVVGIIDKKMIHNDVLSTIASITAVLGIFWMMFSAVRIAPAAARFDRDLLRRRAASPKAGDMKTAATNRLPSGDEFQPVPSVVEDTTELLKEPRS